MCLKNGSFLTRLTEVTNPQEFLCCCASELHLRNYVYNDGVAMSFEIHGGVCGRERDTTLRYHDARDIPEATFVGWSMAASAIGRIASSAAGPPPHRWLAVRIPDQLSSPPRTAAGSFPRHKAVPGASRGPTRCERHRRSRRYRREWHPSDGRLGW